MFVFTMLRNRIYLYTNASSDAQNLPAQSYCEPRSLLHASKRRLQRPLTRTLLPKSRTPSGSSSHQELVQAQLLEHHRRERVHRGFGTGARKLAETKVVEHAEREEGGVGGSMWKAQS